MDDRPVSQQASTSATTLLPLPPPPPPVVPKQPKTRSRFGCMTCRKRKHKCGEERPTCKRCIHAGLECVWPTAEQLPQGRKPRALRPPASVRRTTPSGTSTPGAPYPPLRPPAPPPPGSASPFSPHRQLPALGGEQEAFTFLPGAQLDPSQAAAAHLWSNNAVAGPSTLSQQQTFDFASLHQLAHDPARVWDLGADPTAAQAWFDLPPTEVALAAAGNSNIRAHSSPPMPSWLPDQMLLGTMAGQSVTAHAAGGLPPELHRPPSPSLSDLLRSPTPGPAGIFEGGADVVAQAQAQAQTGREGWTLDLPRYSTPTSSLEMLYPNPEERSLLAHFLIDIGVIFIGRPQSSSFRALSSTSVFLPGEQPDLTSLLPYLDLAQLLSTPRGASTATDALALALMSVSAVHLSHLHHTAGMLALAAGNEAARALAERNEKRMRTAGSSLVGSALSLAQTALDLADLDSGVPSAAAAGGRDAADRSTETTHLLSTCAMAILTRCISGGKGYGPALELAKDVVARRGGARGMLADLSAAIAQGGTSRASPANAQRRRRLRMLRSVLEDLTLWELLASLSTGRAPARFASAGASGTDGEGTEEVLQSWLFAFAPPTGARDMTEVDWETVETTWGTSRAVIELFARVNTLCAASRDPSADPSAASSAASDLLAEVRLRRADLQRAYPELARDPLPLWEGASAADEAEEYRCRMLFGKLGGAGADLQAGGMRRARRLEMGDLLWCLTFEIMLRTEVHVEPESAPEVAALARRIIEVVQASDSRRLVQLGYMWPIILAGSMLTSEHDRARARAALETLRAFCLFDLDAAFVILDEVWAGKDGGRLTSWRDVTARNGGLALI